MTSETSRSAIGLLAPASGPLPLVSRDGPTTDLFGQPVVPVSHIPSLEAERATMIQGICGRTYFESYEARERSASDLLSSWESRLVDRMAMVGSTECALIWRRKVTPAGHSIFRLAPSTLHSNGTGSGGSLWPAPKAANAGPDFAKVERSATGISLQTAMAGVTYWVAPSARDWKDSEGMATEGESRDGDQIALPGMEKNRSRIDRLPRQMIAQDRTEAGGPTPSGSSAMTKKRGAPNPGHPCWLMGWSAELISGACAAILSTRSSTRR